MISCEDFFFLENIMSLGQEEGNTRSVRGEDLFFFRKRYKFLLRSGNRG